MKSSFLCWLFAFTTLVRLPLLAADPAPADDKVGATLPWVTYTAKDATLKGEILTAHGKGDIAYESVNGTCARLNAAGDSVEWKISAPANTIVVRFSIPDAPTGGGANGSLGLFVNHQFRQQLNFNSRFAWLYGPEENAQGNDPSLGSPHHFFDEAHAFISGAPLQAGDVVSLGKRAEDGAGWCIVDLIDLELVAPPAMASEGSLSITDFGAVPDDGKDDTAAIEACLAQAKAQGKTVWFPPGTYDQTHILVLDGVAVRGAGPWYTRLTTLDMPTKEMGFKGNCGFNMTGSGSQVRDLMIEGIETSRPAPQQRALVGNPQNFVVENVWIEHTGTGAWIGPCAHGVIRGCRVRDTFADGLNMNNCAQDILVEQNACRNTGDDGLAEFSGADKGGLAGPCDHVTFRYNTVDSPWWANCVGLYGGRSILVEKNLLRGGGEATGISVTTGYSSRATESMDIRDNDIIACGGMAWKQHQPAVNVYSPGTPITGLIFERNRVSDAVFSAFSFLGLGKPGNRIEATLSDNEIDQPGEAFITARGKTEGWLKLQGNKISGLPEGKPAIVNSASATFQIQDADAADGK